MAVANHLNFSRAAERLRITQPAVSHQINTLEDELGTKLFRRTSKSVRLTQEGYLFTQYAGEILKLSDLSKARIKESRAVLPLRLGIGCRSALELRLLQPALERLRREVPDLLPLLRLIPFDSLENLLEEGDIQLMFSFRDSAPKKTRYLELTRCPVVCVCAEDHPLAQNAQLSMEQLRLGGRLAACRPPVCPPVLFELQGQAVSGRGPDQLLFCDNQEVLSAMVQAGYAFSLAPDFPRQRVPGLRYIPMPQFQPLSFGAVYLPGKTSPALRQVLNVLAQCFSTSEG